MCKFSIQKFFSKNKIGHTFLSVFQNWVFKIIKKFTPYDNALIFIFRNFHLRPTAKNQISRKSVGVADAGHFWLTPWLTPPY